MAKKRSGGSGFWICIMIIAVITVANVIKNNDAPSKDFDSPVIVIDDADSDFSGDGTADSIGISVDDHRRMYSQLSADQQSLYSIILDTVSNGGLTVNAFNIEISDGDVKTFIDRAVQAVYHDYPEFFWINNGNWQANYTQILDSNKYNLTVNIECYDYWNYVSNPNTYINAVMGKAKAIVVRAEMQTTAYDKVKAIHDYLVTNVVYDNVCLDEIDQTKQRASSEQSHSVYGALVSDLAVCDGYAKAFQLLTNMLGIECEFIRGYAGEYHAWNYIKLDGELYWMDVTWDDSNITDDNGNIRYPYGVEYGYFCITSDQLTLTHTPDDFFDVPDCVSTDYNYFIKEGLYLEDYDFDSYFDAVSKIQNKQIISVRFSSLTELKEAADDLLYKNYKYKDIPFYTSGDLSFYSDETHNILSIYLD